MKLSADRLRALSLKYGEAFYLFDQDGFRRNYDEFLAAFQAIYPDSRIAYSYKTNYLPWICREVDRRGGCAEVVSGMELWLARQLGVRPERTYFNGPFKTRDELKSALEAGVHVNLDSPAELAHVIEICAVDRARAFQVGLRCNLMAPDESASRFGIDVHSEAFAQALARIEATDNLKLTGLHCHYPFRDLDSYRRRVEGMAKVLARYRFPDLQYLSFGGGYFGRLPAALARTLTQPAPSFSDYAQIVAGFMRNRFPQGGVRLILEPGSALVADVMALVTQVVSVKRAGTRAIATVAASSFNVNPLVKGVSRPLEVVRAPDSGDGEYAHWDLAGYTCIESDYLATDVRQDLAVGDFIIMRNVGSYSLVFKPPFILPSIAVVALTDDGGEQLLKHRETPEGVFSSFLRTAPAPEGGEYL